MHSIQRIAVGVALLLLVGCLSSEILFDLIPIVRNYQKVNQVRSELALARKKWESANIISYTFEVKGAFPMLCFYNAKLTVQNNEIVKVLTRQDLFDDSSPLVPLTHDKWKDTSCDFEQFTVARIFDDLEETLMSINPSQRILEASFDPNLGYVTSIKSAMPVGNGFFSPKISECCYRFTFSNFQTVIAGDP